MATASGSIPGLLNDGTRIPQIGFGALNVQPDRETTAANIDTTARAGVALEASYWHIDTTRSYDTEPGGGNTSCLWPSNQLLAGRGQI
jgi:2,5-diketo-D-gluconate reductase A